MRYHVDGFLLGDKNPSKKGGGYTIVTEGEGGGDIIRDTTKEPMSNNTAEIMAILEALKMGKDGDRIYSDSQIAIWWVRKGYIASKTPIFQDKWTKEMIWEAHELYKQKNILILWIKRDYNCAGIENDMDVPNTEKYDLRRRYGGIFNEADEVLQKDVSHIKFNGIVKLS